MQSNISLPESKQQAMVFMEKSVSVSVTHAGKCSLSLARMRKAEERSRKEEELRRLKNIKRREIHERLQAIQDMSGGALIGGKEADLEGDQEASKGAAGMLGAEALVDGDFDPEK